jgi:hypothetical protein
MAKTNSRGFTVNLNMQNGQLTHHADLNCELSTRTTKRYGAACR